MGKVALNGIEVDVPDSWKDQGMITFTIPSADKAVKPNIILTKENLPQPIDLQTYCAKIKEAVARRGIKDFKISDEREMVVGGLKAMQMICTWDVSAMRQMLGPDSQQALQNLKEGQVVKQVQVTMLKGTTAINITASFPLAQFEIYYRPFQTFLKSFRAT